MKKYLITLPILLLGFSALPAFAISVSVSVDPATVASGGESAVSITATTGGFPSGLYNHFFLFSPSNISVSNGTGLNGFDFDSPTTWSDANMPTSNAAGTYTVLDAANSSDFTSVCGSGNTLSDCESAVSGGFGFFATTPLEITSVSPTSTPSSTTPCAMSGAMNSSTLGNGIDCTNSTTSNYFNVLLAKYWPFLIGFIILVGVWHFGRKILNAFN